VHRHRLIIEFAAASASPSAPRSTRLNGIEVAALRGAQAGNMSGL